MEVILMEAKKNNKINNGINDINTNGFTNQAYEKLEDKLKQDKDTKTLKEDYPYLMSRSDEEK